MPSLLLGCGRSRIKKVALPSMPDWTGDLVTLDMDPANGADAVWDLENRPLPFEDNQFDEIGAYDVLEHVGRQGDWKGFFEEFAEYWRILKPGGLFGILVPIGPDMHADIGHTRFWSASWFRFLDQTFYERKDVTDYRWFWKRDFQTVVLTQCEDHHIAAVLRKRCV